MISYINIDTGPACKILIPVILFGLLLGACAASKTENSSVNSTAKDNTGMAVTSSGLAQKASSSLLLTTAPAGSETAAFGMGWFWGPDARFGHMNGVLRTQVGYAGGTKKNPAYHSLGDHTETIRIDYDPKKVSYSKLLDIFWANHDPAAQPWSKQYKSVIFYHNDEQKRLASETKTRLEEKIKRKVYTEIVPASEFYLAEDYHQKYYLRNAQELMQVFKEIYPADADFISSTSAARINGYLGGYGKNSELEKELSGAGLHHETVKRILTVINGQRRY